MIWNPAERGSTWRREIAGGAATFITMAYIIIVNPAILSQIGLPMGASTVATILAAAFGSILMGLYADRPIAVAPYMGENAFIAFSLPALGVTWPEIMGIVFVSGALFAILTVFRLRSWLLQSISPGLKNSFAVGIGLFLALIGLYETGIITSAAAGMPAESLLNSATHLLSAPPVPMKLGSIQDPRVLLAIGGFIVICMLSIRRIPGALLLGMIITAFAGYLLGLGKAPEHLLSLPFSGKYEIGVLFMKLQIVPVLQFSLFPVFLTLFLMTFLDTLGTLVAVGASGDMLDKEGNIPDVEKPMMVDALTCMFSGVVGTSSSGAYIESLVGIREGAGTGMSAVITGLLFLAALFFIPLVEPLQQLTYAYGPALIFVGLLMVPSIARIDFEDLTEWVPAFAAIVMMACTFNIADGMTAGLLLYPVMKVCAGKGKELSAGSIVLALLCLGYYVFGLPH